MITEIAARNNTSLIILLFCRLEVQQGSHWASIKMSAGLSSFPKEPGANLFPGLGQLPEAVHGFSLMDTSSTFNTRNPGTIHA